MTEQQLIKQNLAVIRTYLKSRFPDYTITEESHPSLHHKFIVTNGKLDKRYKLKVGWPRLSDRSNTPEKTSATLALGEVASCMIQAGDDGFYW